MTAAIERAEQVARREVRDRLVQYATHLWGSMGSWRDADVERFVATITPRILAGQRTIAQLTDGYLSGVTGARGVGVVDLTRLRGGASAADVYARPAVTMRTDLADGKPFPDALAASTRRLANLVATDLQLAMTHQARAFGRARGVEAWARTLTGSENCALCLIASTQRYHRGDLMPIHPGCDCGIRSLGVGEHPEQAIDPDLLEATHQQVAEMAGISDRGGRAVDYRTLIATREHGEIGPVLTWRRQSFTSEADLGA